MNTFSQLKHFLTLNFTNSLLVSNSNCEPVIGMQTELVVKAWRLCRWCRLQCAARMWIPRGTPRSTACRCSSLGARWWPCPQTRTGVAKSTNRSGSDTPRPPRTRCRSSSLAGSEYVGSLAGSRSRCWTRRSSSRCWALWKQTWGSF